jgi:hypothetical protein
MTSIKLVVIQGGQNLYQKCFSIYRVDFIRCDDGLLRGYKVIWLTDYTHRIKTHYKDSYYSQRRQIPTKVCAWSPKGNRMTVPIDPYQIYLYDVVGHHVNDVVRQIQFCGWKRNDLIKQIKEYQASISNPDNYSDEVDDDIIDDTVVVNVGDGSNEE